MPALVNSSGTSSHSRGRTLGSRGRRRRGVPGAGHHPPPGRPGRASRSGAPRAPPPPTSEAPQLHAVRPLPPPLKQGIGPPAAPASLVPHHDHLGPTPPHPLVALLPLPTPHHPGPDQHGEGGGSLAQPLLLPCPVTKLGQHATQTPALHPPPPHSPTAGCQGAISAPLQATVPYTGATAVGWPVSLHSYSAPSTLLVSLTSEQGCVHTAQLQVRWLQEAAACSCTSGHYSDQAGAGHWWSPAGTIPTMSELVTGGHQPAPF